MLTHIQSHIHNYRWASTIDRQFQAHAVEREPPSPRSKARKKSKASRAGGTNSSSSRSMMSRSLMRRRNPTTVRLPSPLGGSGGSGTSGLAA